MSRTGVPGRGTPSRIGKPLLWIGLALAVLALAPSLIGAPSAADSPYHVVARYVIGGEGGWDYMTADAEARRLYVTHNTRVEVLDLDSGKSVGAIEGTAGAHGVAIVPKLGRGFIASGRDSAVVVFDLKSLAVTNRLHVPGRFPDALLYEPVSGRIFTFNGGSDNTAAFDAASGAFIDSLPLGGTPEFAVADGEGKVYANLESTSEIVTFDAKKLKVLRRASLAPGEEPTGLALDRAHHLLFSGCHNRKLMVTDANTGKVVTTLPIGEGVDAVAYDSKRRVVFTSNGDGTLSVAREGKEGQFAAVETDSTQRGARTLALDEKTGRVFVVTASFGPPPEPTAERPHPRPTVLPGTFVVLALDH
jgi:DNA-binding beta-propeller fold protein YncE